MNKTLELMKIFKSIMMAAFVAIIFLSACTKNDFIGDNILEMPGDRLGVEYVDTMDITAYSVIDDSVRTDETTVNLLGSVFDNEFGTTTAGFYTQVRLSSNNLAFGTNATCDSVVLSLRYNGLYGDSFATHTISVFELDADLYKDSAYYSKSTLNYLPTALCTKTMRFTPSDSVLLNNQKVAPHIRLKLDNSFGTKIIAKGGMTELSNNENFLKFLKGFYISSSKTSNDGSIAYIELINTISNLTLYYHNSTDTSLKTVFYINDLCGRFTSYNHYNYVDASTAFKNQVLQKDSLLGNQKLYVQSMGGVSTYLKINGLENLQNGGKIALQKAELILRVDPNTISTSKPVISTLGLAKVNSSGGNSFLVDYQETSSYFGGYFNSSDNSYRFTITRHIQNLLQNQEIDYGLRVLASGAAVKANRSILNGPKALPVQMKIKLMYTKVTQ